MKRGMLLAWGLCGLLPMVALADDVPSVRAANDAPPESVAEELRKALAPTCYVVEMDGKTLARYWLVEKVASMAEQEPVLNSSVTEGTFFGVAEILSDELTDFRDQELLEGVFTMRLGIQPQDGNHMGVAPFPEFLCLVPAAMDTALAAIEHDDLMTKSKEAAGTGHPCVLYLKPFIEKPEFEFPTVTTDELELVLLNLKTKAELADGKVVEFPLAMVIIGVTQAE